MPTCTNQGWARGGEGVLAPSCRAPHGHDQTLAELFCFSDLRHLRVGQKADLRQWHCRNHLTMVATMVATMVSQMVSQVASSFSSFCLAPCLYRQACMYSCLSAAYMYTCLSAKGLLHAQRQEAVEECCCMLRLHVVRHAMLHVVLSTCPPCLLRGLCAKGVGRML